MAFCDLDSSYSPTDALLGRTQTYQHEESSNAPRLARHGGPTLFEEVNHHYDPTQR